MADPTLKRTSVVLKYTASDGYRSEFEAKGGTGTKHLVTCEEVPPEKALLAGLAELSRILTLFGMEVEAQKVFGEARQAVHEWRAHLAPKAGVAGTPVPQCAARSTAHVPGELSAIWCERCGEGTTAGGICRDRNDGVPLCHAPYCGCMSQGGPGPCAAKLAASD